MRPSLVRKLCATVLLYCAFSQLFLLYRWLDKHKDYSYSTSVIEINDNKQHELLVVVPGFGDITRLQTLKQSLNSIDTSYNFQCLIYVYNKTLLNQVKHEISYCDIQYNVGLWTHHMSKVQLFDTITHVAILMDDIDISSIDILNFLHIQNQSSFNVASASIADRHYPAMRTRDQCLSHQTNFTDILFTIFDRNAWLCWQKHINLDINHYGWGYDVTFNILCNVSIGIIDDNATAIHVGGPCEGGGACTRSYNSDAASNQMLSWIQFAFKTFNGTILSRNEADNYFKYVTLERSETFPRCSLYRKE
eukprot:492826_1